MDTPSEHYGHGGNIAAIIALSLALIFMAALDFGLIETLLTGR